MIDFSQLLNLMQFGPTDAQVAKMASVGDPSMAANLPGMGGGQGMIAQPMAPDTGIGNAIIGAGTGGQGFNLAPAGQPSSPMGLQAPPSKAAEMGAGSGMQFDPAMLMAIAQGAGGQQVPQQQIPRAPAVNVGGGQGQLNLASLLPVQHSGAMRRPGLGELLKG